MADHREKERKIDKIVGEGGEELSLDWKHLNDSSMQYVASKQFSHVRAVNMIGNQFSYKAIGSFTGIRLNSLQELYFNFNNIGSKGCRLLTHGKWPCLRVLALESCNIENAGTAHLSKGEWKALQNLNLSILSLKKMKISSLEMD